MKQTVYKKGQIVWAKVRGYPWWPSLVNETNKKKNGAVERNVSLTFLAENKTGVVPTPKILNYEANFEKLSVIRNKKLQEAVQIVAKYYGLPKLTITISKSGLDNNVDEDGEEEEMEEEENTQEEENLNENEEETAEIDDKEKDNTANLSSKQEEKSPENEDNIMEEEDEDDIQVMRPKRVESKPKKEKENLTKLEQKQKIKEEEKSTKNQNAIDLLQRRSTRSQAKTDQIEMFTEPLIYSHRKIKKQEKGHSKSNDNESIADESESKGSSKEHISPERHIEEKNLKSETNKNMKTEKTKLGKRPLTIKEEKDKKPVTSNVAEDIDIMDDKKIPEKVKQITKKVKVAQKAREDAKSEQSIDPHLDGKSSVGASSSFNHIANNENKAGSRAEKTSDHSGEFQNQTTSGKTSGNKENISHSPAKLSKHLKNVQVVSHTQANDAFLRKSVCQKLAKLLEEVYSLNKDDSQELTLYLEGRINSYFIEDINYYKKVMKILYKLMKARMLKLEELRSIINLEYHEFKSWLQRKIETAISFQEESPKAPTNQDSRKNFKSSPTGSELLAKNESLLQDSNPNAELKNQNNIIDQDEA